MNRNIAKWVWIAFFTCLFVLAQTLDARAAETMDIQEDELAQETVLPKFDRPESVKNRNITTANRFEFGGYYGWNILEPIQNQSKIGFNAGYHLSEQSALMVNYAQWQSGLNTQYTDGLSAPNNYLDFTRAPKLKYSLYGHYEWKIFYGKISVTKQGVVNLSTYPIFGAGITAYEHKNYFGADIGIGQKFYFGKSVALRADFKFQYSQKPSPFLQGAMKKPPATGTAGNGLGDIPPQPGDFTEKWDMGTMLEIGVSFLL
jgi:outer membrane beta-barrel protein